LAPGGRWQTAGKLSAVIEADSSLLEPASAARRHGIWSFEAYRAGDPARVAAIGEAAARAYGALGDLRNATEMLANVAAGLADLGLCEEADRKFGAVRAAAERMQLGFLLAYVYGAQSQVDAFSGR